MLLKFQVTSKALVCKEYSKLLAVVAAAAMKFITNSKITVIKY